MEHEFRALPNFDQIRELWEKGVVVLNDGTQVDESITKDIAPEVGWENWGITLGIKTVDCILDIKVVDGVENTGFCSIREVSPRQPWCFTPKGTPVPCVMWVMDVLVAPHSFGPTLFDVIFFIVHLP